LRNKIRIKENPASSRYFKTLGDPIFQIFQNQKSMGSRFTQGEKNRIKYLPVLGISKPSETHQFSQNNQKRTGRFLGGSVLSPVSRFWRTMAVCEKQGVGLSESCDYAP
jgi:hypothetical protein